MTRPWSIYASTYACAALIALGITSGCVTTAQGELDKLNDRATMIIVGETTRQTIAEEFGKPTSTFQEGEIVVYVFRRVENGPLPRTPLPPEGYGPQLVLEFDGEDTVARFATLVPP